jgi:hypothetical protein
MLRKLPNGEEATACKKSFPGWGSLIKEALQDVISAVDSCGSHLYVVYNGCIGYKDQDTISTKVSYGYQTLFAYFKECEAGNVTEQTKRDNIALHISCGAFSYAEVAKKYEMILGVTGTLEDLAESQSNMLKTEYKISKSSCIPSVYGANQLTFAGNNSEWVRIEEEKSFFPEIALMISEHETEQAVFVFFDTASRLKAFHACEEMVPIVDYVTCATPRNTT